MGRLAAGMALNAEGVLNPNEFSWAVEMALTIEGSFVDDKKDEIELELFKLPAIYK